MSLITFKELPFDDGLEVNKRAQIFEQEEKISSTKTFARELVQNSLDARIDPSSKAILKFKIHKNLQTKFINDLREELSGPLNYSQSLDEGVTKNVLVVEEFGTSGLDGSIETISDSNHSGFWHNTGARKGWGKQKEDGSTAGGAGVGNIALFLVSGLKTVLALTVRNNDNDLPYYFMGKTELRDSWFKDGDKEKPAFKYKGFYANRNEERALIEPYQDKEKINTFIDQFELQRSLDEPGTSFIIPDIHEEITKEFLICNLLEEYHYAVFCENLELHVEDVVINLDTLEKVFDEYVKEDKHPNTNKAFRNFQYDCRTFNDDHLISVKESWIEDKWALKEENFISDKELEDAKNKFDLNKIIGFKVPLKISPIEIKNGKKKNLPKIDTYIKFFIKKDENIDKPFQMVLRQFLVISREPTTSKHNLPVFALLLIEENEISKFALRCEADNHIRFDNRSNIAKQYYKDIASTISSIRRVFDSFIKFFYGLGADIERDLLIDLLSVPLIDITEFDDPDVDVEEEQDEDEEGEDEDDEDEDEDDEEQRSEYFYLVNDEGWSIVSRDENPIPYFPFKIKAIFAPATQETIHNSKAKPSDYDPCDFDLSDEVFNFDSRGLDFEASFNEIEITINDPDFHLTVTGFPENKRVIGSIEYSIEEDQ